MLPASPRMPVRVPSAARGWSDVGCSRVGFATFGEPSPVDPNALRAVLTGVGTLTATLGAAGWAQAFIDGSGMLSVTMTGVVGSVVIPVAVRLRTATAMIRLGVNP
jgi:hypothetical protein